MFEDDTNIRNLQLSIQASLADPAVVRQHLVDKMCLKFGVDIESIQPYVSLNLLVVMSKCLELSWPLLHKLNAEFSKMLNVPQIALPSSSPSIHQYFAYSQSIIDNYELYAYNPLNASYMPNAPKYVSNFAVLTVMDCISNTIVSDTSFIRTIANSATVFTENHCSKLGHLIEALDTVCNSVNILTIRAEDFSQEEWIMDDTYHPLFSVVDKSLLKYIPKVSNYHVTIGKTVFPDVCSLCRNVENCLYYCAWDGDVQSINKPSKFLTYNKVIATEGIVDTVRQKVNEAVKEGASSQCMVYTIAEIAQQHDLCKNKYFVINQLKTLLTHCCPTKSVPFNPNNNILLYEEFVLQYYNENIDRVNECLKHLNNNTGKHKENTIILVDNRKNIMSVVALAISLSNLDLKRWNVVVVCNKSNEHFFYKFFGDKVEYTTDLQLPSKKFSIDLYNNMLKSENFWMKFQQYKKVLFIQDDGMLLLKGVEELFLHYDYVGAPWKQEWCLQNPNKFLKETINENLVGNGGLSLRSPEQMLNLVKKYKKFTKSLHYDQVQQQPEDVFFSWASVKEGLSMPSYDIAQGFASEQCCNKKSLGFHKPWPYCDLKTMTNYLSQYLKKPLLGQ
jgi:hypothetical protein